MFHITSEVFTENTNVGFGFVRYVEVPKRQVLPRTAVERSSLRMFALGIMQNQEIRMAPVSLWHSKIPIKVRLTHTHQKLCPVSTWQVIPTFSQVPVLFLFTSKSGFGCQLLKINNTDKFLQILKLYCYVVSFRRYQLRRTLSVGSTRCWTTRRSLAPERTVQRRYSLVIYSLH